MRTVRDVMHADVEVLRTSGTVTDAASYLASHEVDSVPVCLSDGRLAGAVSARDIVVEVVAKGRDPRDVSLVELTGREDAVSLDVDCPIEEAAALLCRHGASWLPVLEGQRVVGLATRRDVACSAALRPWWEEA